MEQRNCRVLPPDPLLLLFIGILCFSSGPAATKDKAAALPEPWATRVGLICSEVVQPLGVPGLCRFGLVPAFLTQMPVYLENQNVVEMSGGKGPL